MRQATADNPQIHILHKEKDKEAKRKRNDYGGYDYSTFPGKAQL
jgi:hypothetical protein